MARRKGDPKKKMDFGLRGNPLKLGPKRGRPSKKSELRLSPSHPEVAKDLAL